MKLLIAILLFSITLPKVVASDIYQIGKQYGIEPTILKAMAKIESDFNSRAIGDRGNSYGLYQINRQHHKVTIRQARDIEWATHWVCQNLNRNGYQTNKFRAVRKHNGSGKMAARYARKVMKQADKYKE